MVGKNMKRFIVSGTLTLQVRTVVEALDEDRAVEEATCAVTAERVRMLDGGRGVEGTTDMHVKQAHMGAFEVPRGVQDLQRKKFIERTGNGVCPCCKRSFTNLRRHMNTKHPNFSRG